MALNGHRLGELLLAADVLTKRQLQKALAMQASGDKRQIGEILIELGYITLEDLTDIMVINGHAPPSKKAPPKPAEVADSIDISKDELLKTKFKLRGKRIT